jgi:drug/metabolite transporter (DMT)-like permease
MRETRGHGGKFERILTRPATMPRSTRALPLIALVLGPMAMGASPVFVRLAEVGPFGSAFWRVGLALPLFFAWWWWERARAGPDTETGALSDKLKSAFWPGLFFAGDLFFWHLSIMNTSVANATFFATLAPIAVVFGANFMFGEKLTGGILAGLGLAVLGAAALMSATLSHAPENLIGDIYGLITAVFFGAYMLSVKAVRARVNAGEFMFFSSAVTTLVLLLVVIATGDDWLPDTWQGVSSLVSLALVSQVGGQGLLAYALGHLPATFSSIVIFLEPLTAAGLGWAVLREAMTWLQIAGGLLILIGIYFARPSRHDPGPVDGGD